MASQRRRFFPAIISFGRSPVNSEGRQRKECPRGVPFALSVVLTAAAAGLLVFVKERTSPAA